MTTQLSDRLHDLADEAPTTLSGSDLWRAARRRQAARSLSALAVVGGLVLAMASVGYGDWLSRRAAPAAPPTPSGRMSIPDRFYNPSPWLPTTSSPGRLVAVMPARQNHLFGSSEGIVGVASGSQRYSFLGLPDFVESASGSVSLAPDGRHLAYPITGPVSEKRHAETGGIAVIDVVSGRVESYPVATQHGIDSMSLTWAGPSTLVALLGVERDAPPHADYASIFDGRALRITVGDPRVLRIPRTHVGSADRRVALPRGLAFAYARSLEVVGTTGALVERLRVSRNLYSGGAMDQTLTHVAAIVGSRSPGSIAAGAAHEGRVALQTVPGGGHYARVLAVLDALHALVVRVSFAHPETELVSVDVRTGRVRLLSTLPADDVQVAGDAVVRPRIVPAAAPPHPWNLRTLTVGLLAALVAAAGLVLLDRSRRRG